MRLISANECLIERQFEAEGFALHVHLHISHIFVWIKMYIHLRNRIFKALNLSPFCYLEPRMNLHCSSPLLAQDKEVIVRLLLQQNSLETKPVLG